MKQYGGNRKVVIVKNPGKGSIEQAIFILKKDITKEEDYILEEAKKIVDEFVQRNGLAGKGSIKKKLIYGVIFLLAASFWYFACRM